MTEFTFTITPAPAGPVIAVAGALDVHTAIELRPAVMRTAEALDAGRELVLDLAELDFIDSSGLSVLIAAHKRCVARGARMRLVNAPAFVRRLLAVTGLKTIFLAAGDAD